MTNWPRLMRPASNREPPAHSTMSMVIPTSDWRTGMNAPVSRASRMFSPM